MKTKEQINKQIEKLQEELKVLEESEKSKDFIEIKFKNKIFRIYKWENKPYGDIINKDFSCKLDKSFKLSEFYEFQELITNKKIELEVWKDYITKHFQKLQWTEEYSLSRCYLSWGSYLSSGNSDLAYSSDNGRVVFVKEIRK